MPRRKTPRPPEEARAIVRALRQRYITPEAEAAAKAAFERMNVPLPFPTARPATPAPTPDVPPDEPTLLQLIRDREGIAANAPLTELPAHETAAEKLENRARLILARIQAKFSTKQ